MNEYSLMCHQTFQIFIKLYLKHPLQGSKIPPPIQATTTCIPHFHSQVLLGKCSQLELSYCLQEDNGVNLTGKQQHGFKKNKSTTTLGLRLQSLIARALDESNYVLMACVFFLVV